MRVGPMPVATVALVDLPRRWFVGAITVWGGARPVVRAAMATAAFLAVGSSVVGCGENDEQAVDSPTVERSVEGALGALAASGDEMGAAIVRSADDGEGPVTSVRLVDPVGGQASVPIDVDAPLYAVEVWTTPASVGVLGATCPSWVAGPAPRWTDGTGAGDNVRDNCGDPAYVLWQSARDGADPKTIELPALKASNGYAVLGVRGDRVLLLGQGDKSGYVVLDLASGAVEELPEAPASQGIVEATFTPCLDGTGEPFGVYSWSAAVPEGIAALGWDVAPQVMVTAGGQSVAAVTPSGDGGWDLVEATGSVDAFDGVMGCGPDGVWAISATGATVDVVGGIAKLQEMPPLPTGVEVWAYRLASLGSPLFVTQAPPGEAPDAPRPATGHVLEDGRWRTIPTADLGSGSRPFRNGEVISSLSPDAVGWRVRLDAPV